MTGLKSLLWVDGLLLSKTIVDLYEFSVAIPRLKSRPQDNYNSSGAATSVAEKTLYAV
jgi:hypothetical protein